MTISRTVRTRRQFRSGQVAVETAIVLPFFIFYILGTLQLGLMHQARLMTKYAAYKAARVGSIHSAKKAAMEKAALGVVLPFAARGDFKKELSYKTANSGEFTTSWTEARLNTQGLGNKVVEVTICNPTKSMVPDDFDFDDSDKLLTKKIGDSWQEPNVPDRPKPGATQEEWDAYHDDLKDLAKTWKEFWTGRLNVQVTFYYRMPIPFANGVLWYMTAAQENRELLRVLRAGPFEQGKSKADQKRTQANGEWTIQGLVAAAKQNIYIMPIRENYGMRMQSNFIKSKFELPESNKCAIPWKRRD